MDAGLYASDLTDAEWALLEPLVPRSHPAGRRQTYPLRCIVDAIFYFLRSCRSTKRRERSPMQLKTQTRLIAA
jgi:transposase